MNLKNNSLINRENQYNFYIYKITFESNKTYIGQRCYDCKYGNSANTDTYMGSSRYARKNPQDKITNKEILIENVKDIDTLNFLETWCILSELAYNKNNCVNGNYGGWIFTPSRFGKRYTTDEINKLKESHNTNEYIELQRRIQKEIRKNYSEEKITSIITNWRESRLNNWNKLTNEEKQKWHEEKSKISKNTQEKITNLYKVSINNGFLGDYNDFQKFYKIYNKEWNGEKFEIKLHCVYSKSDDILFASVSDCLKFYKLTNYKYYRILNHDKPKCKNYSKEYDILEFEEKIIKITNHFDTDIVRLR